MFRRYLFVAVIVLFLFVAFGMANIAQRPNTPRQPDTTGTPPALPDGFRGANPPPVVTPDDRFAPTLTPTTDISSGNGTNSWRWAGETYAIIPAGNEAMLFEALAEAAEFDGEQPGVPYKIYLAAGEYQLAQTLVVFGTVEIYGADMATTILRQVVPHGTDGMNTMIKIPGKSLKIDHVTLVDGATDFRGGAINVENTNGVLTVTNSKFLNNQADDSTVGSGGAIYSVGQVFLEKVYFEGNTSREGGAISNLSSITDFAVDARNVDFFANSASTPRGGAIYNGAGKIKVRQSNFRANSSTSGNSVRKHTFSHITTSVTINARNNYWNNPTVGASANINGVNTLDLLTAKVNFTLDAPQTPPQDECGIRQCPVPTNTPTRTPTPTPVIPFKYRAINNGTLIWGADELQSIADGAMKIGIAFDYLASTLNNPQSAFNLAMMESSGTEILFIRINQAASASITITNYQYQYGTYVGQTAPSLIYPGVAQGECFTYQESSGPPIRPAAIICNGQMKDQWTNNVFTGKVTEYAAVHEMGHLFDYWDNTFLISAPIDGSFELEDCNGDTVMGAFGTWTRGRRGWGTGPAQYLNNGTAVPYLSYFQQNSANSALEAAADSFLNWVFRLNATNGIQATDSCIQSPLPPSNHWTGPGYLNAECSATPLGAFPGHNAGTTGTPDASLPGDVRYFDFDARMRQIFQSRGW